MKEIYRDTGLLTGTHHGSDGASSLYDPNIDFEITYAIGRLLENVTQSTSGVVTAQTATTATASGVTWNNGDSYILYVTDTKNSVISSTEICRMSGFAHPYWELGSDGIYPPNRDEDRRKLLPGTGRRRVNLRR